MKFEQFPSPLERDALQLWHDRLDWHIKNWDSGKTVETAPVNSVALGPGAAFRPIENMDRPAEAVPHGWMSMGHDPESFSEHLQAQADIHNEVVNQAVREWGEYWINPTREVVRPRLDGEADSYFWLRVCLARGVISGILSGQLVPFRLTKGRPDFTDQAKTLNWLMIDLWNAIGSSYLQTYAAQARANMRFKIKGVDSPPDNSR